MSQSQWFRTALEIQHQISLAAPKQQGGLLNTYNVVLGLATATAKVPTEQMHRVIMDRLADYTKARISGKSEAESFAIAAAGLKYQKKTSSL